MLYAEATLLFLETTYEYESLYGSIGSICTFIANYMVLLVGLQADGIYRISGNQSDIQKLRFYIDQSECELISKVNH